MAPVFETISSAQTAGPSTSLTIPAPSGLAVGDLIVVGAMASIGAAATLSLPVGYTKLDQTEPAIGNPKGVLGTKVAELGDIGASIIITTGPSVFGWAGAAYRISGGGAVSFAVGTEENILNGPTATAPNLVTVVDNSLILRMALGVWTGFPPTMITPASGTEVAEEIVSSRDIACSWVVESPPLLTPPGSTGTLVFTVDNDPAGRTRAVQYTVGIAPAPVIPPPGAGPIGSGPFRLLGRRWRVLGTGA